MAVPLELREELERLPGLRSETSSRESEGSATPEAQADVAEARRWYGQRGAGLDARFLDDVESSIESLSDHPEHGPIVEGAIRRLLLRNFPYSIFYVLYPKEAVVIACLHAARSPQAWRRRGAG